MDNTNRIQQGRRRALLADGLRPYLDAMAQELQKLDVERDQKMDDLHKVYDELKADVRADYRGIMIDFTDNEMADSNRLDFSSAGHTTGPNGFRTQSPAALSLDEQASDTQMTSFVDGPQYMVSRQSHYGGVAPPANMFRGPPVPTQCADDTHVRSRSVSITIQHNKSLTGPITKARSRHIRKVFGDMKHANCGKPFATAVDSIFYPDYYDVVDKPMDLQLMTENLNEGRYYTVEALLDDLELIVKAAYKYNGDTSEMAEAADEMSAVLKEKLKAMPDVEVEDQIPSRKKRKTAADVAQEVHEDVDCPDDVSDTDYQG